MPGKDKKDDFNKWQDQEWRVRAREVYWHFVVLEPRRDLTLRGRAVRAWRAKVKDKSLRTWSDLSSACSLEPGAITFSRRLAEWRIRKRMRLTLVRPKTLDN
ncbi:hypothetical protein PoB_005890600 [Plakobranchus ocellatus]|uniref:Uncharacterized protein n=1 Tax=Plakobranchus ocellatus TaxID=259542 RepID=A0AAV4CL61_9GAST|nr:hypothetical protein PoB_005890600 [Plakobranchus ocellatus]